MRLQVVVLHDVRGLAPEPLQLALLLVDQNLAGELAIAGERKLFVRIVKCSQAVSGV